MRGWAILGLSIGLALVTGCRHRHDPVYDARRVERYERNLIELAARESGCSPVQIVPVRVGETLWVANTCSGPREYFLDCRSRGARWASCRWDRIATVPEAAASQLGCPPQALAQQPGPVPTTRYVQGCGMWLQLSLRCNSVACGWIADGPPQRAVQASAPPPAGYTPHVIVIQRQ